MNINTAEISLSELQIDAYIEELGSKQALIRQAAIAQLQQFLDHEKVVRALTAHSLVESDSECRRDLEQILKLARSSADSVVPTEGVADSAAEIVRLWFSADTRQLSALTRRARRLPKDEQSGIFCEIVDRLPEPARILPALDFSPPALAAETVLARLENLLTADSILLKIRATSLLTRIKPVRLIKYLPGLLMHKNVQVRLPAIKALHALSRSEAVRLLNELISSSDLGRQMSAFTFLFVLPFEDTSDILIRIIESGNLPFNLDQAIRYLIYNNPDSKFFKRLTISWLLHGKRMTALKSYCELAAHSLVVAGLTQKTQQELIDEALISAREFIARHTSRRDDRRPAVAHEVPGDLKNHDLASLSGLEKMTSADEERLLAICKGLVEPSELAIAIRLIGRHKLVSTPFCDWLENLVEHESPEIVLKVIETLQQTGKSRLLAHLPVLVFHADAAVAESSLKVYAAFWPDKFIEKLKLWLKDSNSKVREVASKGLLEIEFLQALDLLIACFRTCTSPDLIKFYSPVLLLNPDRLSVYKLNNLAGRTSGEKRKVLAGLAESINAELSELGRDTSSSGVSSLISEANLREQWLIILARIQKITYDNQSLDFGDLIQTKAVTFALVSILVLALLVFIARFELSAPTGKPIPVAVPETVYSYDLGQRPTEITDDKIARSWDYQLPEPATPPEALYQALSLEEITAVYEELIAEAGSSPEILPSAGDMIRLEAEFNR